jgi:hypothetical protein
MEDLEKLKKQIEDRRNYKPGSSEQVAFDNEIKHINDKYPDEGFHIPQSYTMEIAELYKKKLYDWKC